MNVKKLVYSSLFIALGVLVPQIFHFTGGPAMGGIFLPMHFPVLAAGFLCGPITGLVTGIISPLLSSALTGMPPVPRLWFMLVELAVYGIVSGILYYKMRKNIFLSLIIAMILGRLAYSFVFITVIKFFGISLPFGLGLSASLAKGVPGIVLQIMIIPIVIRALERRSTHNEGIENSRKIVE